jgi:hypothetical protein
MAFSPINILSVYVLVFSSPGNNANPVTEVAAYVIGGPVVLVLGGIAELRWNTSNVTGFEDAEGSWLDPTYILFTFRMLFCFLLLAFLRVLMRLRIAIAKTCPNLER